MSTLSFIVAAIELFLKLLHESPKVATDGLHPASFRVARSVEFANKPIIDEVFRTEIVVDFLYGAFYVIGLMEVAGLPDAVVSQVLMIVVVMPNLYSVHADAEAVAERCPNEFCYVLGLFGYANETIHQNNLVWSKLHNVLIHCVFLLALQV